MSEQENDPHVLEAQSIVDKASTGENDPLVIEALRVVNSAPMTGEIGSRSQEENAVKPTILQKIKRLFNRRHPESKKPSRRELMLEKRMREVDDEVQKRIEEKLRGAQSEEAVMGHAMEIDRYRQMRVKEVKSRMGQEPENRSFGEVIRNFFGRKR
jgi:hypothetical protein